jgi:cysteine desulfurase
MSPRAIYLDNNATTRADPRVVAAMLPFFTEQFANPSSGHAAGAAVAVAVKQARLQVQALVGAAHEDEIVFTSGGTESNNTALLSALDAAPGRGEIVTTLVEHPAILALCRHLEHTRRTKVHYIGVDDRGRLDRDAYRRALDGNVAVVSMMWANNETGIVNPVAELAALARAAGALFHTDAVQAVGKLPIDLQSTAIDMLSLSGHKLQAPKGIGALYVRRGTRFASLLKGGRQERGRRAGTENVPGIVALGAASKNAVASLDRDMIGIARLRDRLEQGLLRRIDQARVIGDSSCRLPNTSNIAFEAVEAEAILLHLDRAGIAASSGSACASGAMQPSHVLQAMGVPAGVAHGAVRFSLGRDNTDDDVDRVLAVLPGIIDRLRAPPASRVAASLQSTCA